MVRVAGIDLAGSTHNPSGVCILSNTRIDFLGVLYSDEEIVSLILSAKPRTAAIDAPLTHSRGYREVDREMIKHGYRVLPPGWRGMKMLVSRAILIKEKLEENSIKVIETHPRSALKSSNCNSVDRLLSMYGISFEKKRISRDELDAVIAALVAHHYELGDVEVVEAYDGKIYLLPRICHE